MATDTEARNVKVLRITSYLLLLAGVITVVPYLLLYVFKQVFQASLAPGHWHAAAMCILVGDLVLFLPLLFIPASALWVWRQSGSHDDKFFVLSRGFFRYLPALSLGLIELFVTAKTGNAYIPAVFGTILIVYSCILLKIDSGGAR